MALSYRDRCKTHCVAILKLSSSQYTEVEVNKALREQSRTWHPDKNPRIDGTLETAYLEYLKKKDVKYKL